MNQALLQLDDVLELLIESVCLLVNQVHCNFLVLSAHMELLVLLVDLDDQVLILVLDNRDSLLRVGQLLLKMINLRFLL